MNCSPPGSSILCPWDFPSKNTDVGCHFFLQVIFPDPGIKPRSPALQVDSLPTEPPGKPTELNSWFPGERAPDHSLLKTLFLWLLEGVLTTSTFLTGLLGRVNETKDKQHRAQCPAGQEKLVITVVALDSFWQTSSLSYILEFEKKSHSVTRK